MSPALAKRIPRGGAERVSGSSWVQYPLRVGVSGFLSAVVEHLWLGMVKFRTSELSDLAIVASWLDSIAACRLWSGSRVSYPVDEASLAESIEYAKSEPWTATSTGTVVAFGQCVPKPESRIHLARLIVAPAYRGMGMGKLLTLHLLGLAQARNPGAISLNVLFENEPAFHLYRSLGFSEAKRPPDEGISTSAYMEYVD